MRISIEYPKGKRNELSGPEWTKHPNIFRYYLLLEKWEKAYENKCQCPTPQNKKVFDEIDAIVKKITLIIEELSSTMD